MSVDKERRAGAPRVPLHTLVEIGAGEGGSAAFEAESVNVTTAGMQLRTAYLPEVGEPLICRFEGTGSEIVVRGEVAWRTEDSYGGDFGVRFLEMDQESLDGLREIMGEPIQPDGPQDALSPEPSAPQVVRGSRVRLHIEGLASPMKARVRDGSIGEVRIGSNLEFLRVGRSVEMEDVEAGGNRPARIERVSVEVEPASHIPQLIVALRFLDVAEQPAPNTDFVEDEDDLTETGDGEASAAKEYEEQSDDSDAYEDDDEADDEQGPAGPGRGAMVWNKVKEVGPKFAVVGQVAKKWGTKAKDAMGGAVASAKKKAAEKVKERQDAKKPRRTTAPPPKGALRRDGSRLKVETPEPADASDAPRSTKPAARKRIPKRAAMVALISVLLTVVGLGFAGNALMSSGEEATAKAEGSGAIPAEALPVEGANADDPGDPPIVPGKMGEGAAGPGLIANVPLFGSMPMSTAAPMAPMAAVPVAAVPAATPPPADPAAAGVEETEDENVVAAADDASDAEEGSDEPDDAKPAKEEDENGSTSFGNGRVSNPVVLTLRMNRKIKGIRGTRQSDGFAIEVVGARSREPAGGLRRQDKRIASSKVVNRGSNSQLTIRFRGEVPDYRVQARGSTLRIVLEGDGKTAASPKSRGKSKRR